MARRKKSSSTRAAKAPAKATNPSVGGDSFQGAIYHGGRMYDGRKKEDVAALQGLVKASKIKSEQLQHLADDGRLTGFGTKAGKSKAARARKAGEEPEISPEENAVSGQEPAEEVEA